MTELKVRTLESFNNSEIHKKSNKRAKEEVSDDSVDENVEEGNKLERMAKAIRTIIEVLFRKL